MTRKLETVKRTTAIVVLMVTLALALVSGAAAGTLGGEPPDFGLGSNGPDFTAVAGVNTVTGSIGPTPNDLQDAFEVIIPSTLEVTSVSYSGPTGSDYPLNLVGCGITGTNNLNRAFSPPQSSCTLSYAISTNFAVSSSAWTVTVNVQVKPSSGDTTPPVVTPPANLTVEATSAAGATVTYANATATDNVGVTSGPTCTPASGSTFPLGTTTVTCTASDAAGNVGSATFQVMVVDTIAPTILSTPSNITAEANSTAGAVLTFSNATASDAVGVTSVVCSPASGSTFPIGTTTVTCTASDAAGNQSSASFTVTVQDTTAPTLNLPADITVEAINSSGAQVNFAVTATDAVDPNPTAICSPLPGSMFPLGTTTVTCTATDASGNQSSATFDVIVQDTTAPVLTVPDDITVEATGPSGAAVPFVATATDVADPNPTVSCSPISGSTFPIGTTTVTCTVTDATGNQSSATFDVIVQDTTAPVLTVPDDITVEATGPAGAAVPFVATAADVTDPNPTVSCSPISGSTFPIGTTTVTCTATDATGNQSSATFDVIVQDTTAPVLTVPANMVVDATGPSGAPVSYDPSATDLVDLDPGIVCGPVSGSLFAIGTHTVSCTATDSFGNQSSASFQVTVLGATEQLDNLYDDLESSSIQLRVKISLAFKLGFVGIGLQFGNQELACTNLTAFADQVQSQVGRGLTAAEAQQMIADANRIKAVIGCSGTPSPPPPSRR